MTEGKKIELPPSPRGVMDELTDLIQKTRATLAGAMGNRPKSSGDLAETRAHERDFLTRQLRKPKATSQVETELSTQDMSSQPEGPSPEIYRGADTYALRFIDWIVRTGRRENSTFGQRAKDVPFENFLRNLWNWQFDSKAKEPDKEKLSGYFDSISDFLTRFGLQVEQPLPRTMSADTTIISEKLSTGIKLPKEIERLGIFPEGIPPIEKMWNRIQLKEVKLNGQNQYFLVLDIDFKKWWATQPPPAGEILQLYLENETKFAGNLKISLGIHLKNATSQNVINYFDFIKNKEQRLAFAQAIGHEDGMTREDIDLLNTATPELEPVNSETINRTFDIQNRVARAPRFKEMFHGWTGKRDTVKADQIFSQAAACDEFASADEFDSTVLLLMSGLGNEQTHSELLPDAFLNPNGDFSTHPKHYAKEMIALIDMMGFWGKKIIESGHSMGGAAKYWFTNDMLERAEKFGVADDKFPQLIAWAENPALRGVNIFLEEFNGTFIKFGLATNEIATSAIKFIEEHPTMSEETKNRLIHAITDQIFGRLMPPIARFFTKTRLVKEPETDPYRQIHASVYALISEYQAVKQETDGLLKQEDFPPEMIARLNRHRNFFLGAVTGEADPLCAASRPKNGIKCGQREKFDEYQLTHPVVSLPLGHFTHLFTEYQEIFCRFIFPFAGVLNPAEMNQLFDSLKLIVPISERPRWLDLAQPLTAKPVNRLKYWGKNPDLRTNEINERLVPFWPDAIKNDARLKQRAMEFVIAVQDKIYFPAISEKDVLSLAKAENLLDMTRRPDGSWVFVRDDIATFESTLETGGSSNDSKKITNEILKKLFKYPEKVNVWRQ